jgi:hypothetical protein
MGMINPNTNRMFPSTLIPINGGDMIDLPNKKTRYVIIDETNGVFLGTYTMLDFQEEIEEGFLSSNENMSTEDWNKSFALFAKDNPFEIYRACSFATIEEAKRFIKDAFGTAAKKLKLKTAPVTCSSYYPDVIDLIKSGHGVHTFDMMDGLESPSKHLH